MSLLSRIASLFLRVPSDKKQLTTVNEPAPPPAPKPKPVAPEGWHFHVYDVSGSVAYSAQYVKVVLRKDKFKGKTFPEDEIYRLETYNEGDYFMAVSCEYGVEAAIEGAMRIALNKKKKAYELQAYRDKYVGDYPPKTLGE